MKVKRKGIGGKRRNKKKYRIEVGGGWIKGWT
jgi:hypothetical protein